MLRVSKHILGVQNLVSAVAVCSVILAMGKNDPRHHSLFSTQSDTIPQDTVRRDTPPNPRRPYFKFRDRYGDKYSNPGNTSPLLPPNPKNIKTDIIADSLGNVTIYEKVGDVDYRPPVRLTFQQFSALQDRNLYREAWKRKNDVTGKTEAKENRLFPKIYMGKGFADIFGGSYVDFRPNGFVSLDFGGQIQRVDNPAFPVRQRRNGLFNFDQQISMNLTGKVGEKLKMTANFDTKSSFQFEQGIKLDFKGFDHDILQSIEAGNVTMNLNTSLIQGSGTLFGVKTKLKFGKLGVTLLASQQRSRINTQSVQNGVQTRNFEIRASEYEENKHFFLSQYFRDNYENWLSKLPTVTSGLVITRLEVYVTNRTNNTTSLRNIAAFMDLGESDKIFRKGNPNISAAALTRRPADNNTNNLYRTLVNNGSATRSADNASNTLLGFSLAKGTDFELLRGVRALKSTEYTFNPQLGYISLNTALRNDEVLAVAFEYTLNGKAYKVGELTEDYQNLKEDELVYLKLLRPSSIKLDQPTWNLMMKNIYSLNTQQLNQQGFQFRIIYRDDITGIDNPSLHEGNESIKNVPLVQIFGLDQLNQLNDPLPDGNFDYVSGLTIDPQLGRIVFPVLEPFGSRLGKYFTSQADLYNKYVYSELYTTTRNSASQQANKNKFYLKGSYQSTSSNNVQLGGLGVQDQTAIVTVGGRRLSEGIDYIIEGGQVTIINQSILASNQQVNISYESPDLFQNTIRSMLGARLDYEVSKDFTLGATLMRLRERPILTRVAIGDEPVNNTVIGADINLKKESRFLTRMLDKLPFISTKEISTVTFNAEVARIIPGVSPYVRGNSYLDDFEGAETPYDLTRLPQQRWHLGSTPLLIQNLQLQNDLSVNNRRAKLAWYNIDNIFYGGINGTARRPDNITEEDVNNHYVRRVEPQEIFRGKAVLPTTPLQSLMDIAYYPDERGPYNYNPDLTTDGKLKNPKTNFAAITRAVNYDVDFDNANIQYLEFWMMDPFLKSNKNYNLIAGQRADQNPGGDLYFNLGNISEDVVKDGRHGFENGFPASGDTVGRVYTSKWGLTPRQQFLLNAFDNAAGARQNQDIGLDGLKNEQELAYTSYQSSFLTKLPGNLTPEARQAILADPSADDYKNYISDEATTRNLKILERYKNYNGLEGNSPENTDPNTFTAAATNVPDNEDLNTDNTISDVDEYYQYKVSLRPSDMVIGKNFIVDKVDTTINGDLVSWYQFRIPIRGDYERVNNISGFKSIRFIRMFLTNFERATVLRMAQLQLVGSQWREYTNDISGSLVEKGIGDAIEPYDAKFTIGTVNVEENSAGNGTTSAYVIPPGTIRDQDITTINSPQLNEQSLKLAVQNLKDRDARAVFKNVNLDLLNYENFKLYVHAESTSPFTRDNDTRLFVRLGTDFQDNYYELEIPLKLSDLTLTRTQAQAQANPALVWLTENLIDIPYNELKETKLQRNRANGSLIVPFSRQYDKYRLTVVGNPDLSSVQLMMIGIRNPFTPTDQSSKSVTVWVDEMSSNGFVSNSGTAAMARLNAKLADFATVTGSFRYTGYGFGGIQQRISERARENTLNWDASAQISLDKLFPAKAGLKLPLFVSYEDQRITPHFNPLDKDIELQASLDSYASEEKRKTIRNVVVDHQVKRSFNLANIQKMKSNPQGKSHLWDISNFTLSYAYSDVNRSNITTETYSFVNHRAGLGYTFTNNSKPLEPFKKAKFLSSPWFRLVKDFNVTLLPSSVTFRGDLDRRLIKTQLRNELLTTDGILPQFEKYFTFVRQYGVNWNLTRSLKVDYTASANAVVDEPKGAIDTQAKRDSVWNNLKRLGRMKLFTQEVSATYKLPLDKFPLTDWINADIRYIAGYNWTAGALNLVDSLGNTIQNNRSREVNSRLDLTKLYNKVKFLKSINETQPANPNRPKTPVKNNLPVTAVKDTVKKPAEFKALKAILRALMTARSISLTYALREQTALPGFMKEASYFGLDKETMLPGIPFILGSQNPAIRNQISEQGAFSKSVYLSMPFRQNFTESITAQTTLEPFRDFKITVTAKRDRGADYQELYRNTDTTGFAPMSLGANKTGTFSMSFISLKTAFLKSDANSSETFNRFISYRKIFNDRLSRENPNSTQNQPGNSSAGNYELNSQDVLIGSFIAAYTGKDPSKVKSSPFFNIPLPNWRVDYSGLSKLPGFKSVFSSVTISHGYSSTYNVGNYNSSLIGGSDGLVSPEGLLGNNYLLPVRADTGTSKRFLPVYVFNNIVISEKFAPLIGINVRTISKMTINVMYNRGRDIGLNLSNHQVTEQTSQDLSLDVRYTKSNLKLPFRINGQRRVLKNEVAFQLNVTYRDQNTIQRKINDEGTLVNDSYDLPTGGNQNIQIKPSVNYTVNQKLSVQAYFDRQINNPRVSTSYNRRDTRFGIQLRYSLTQ